MAGRHRSAGWIRLRALVLATVVFIGGFGLPAFDAIAYHWHTPPASTQPGVPRVEQYGTPLEHAVQCVITHNAPAPRLAARSTVALRLVAVARVAALPAPAQRPIAVARHSPVQPRAPPASLA